MHSFWQNATHPMGVRAATAFPDIDARLRNHSHTDDECSRQMADKSGASTRAEHFVERRVGHAWKWHADCWSLADPWWAVPWLRQDPRQTCACLSRWWEVWYMLRWERVWPCTRGQNGGEGGWFWSAECAQA